MYKGSERNGARHTNYNRMILDSELIDWSKGYLFFIIAALLMNIIVFLKYYKVYFEKNKNNN